MEAGADHGLKPDRIARQLRSSLDRLGVGHVELYLAHEYAHDVPLAEILGAFGAAQAGGMIGAYGVSNFDASQLTAALAAGASAPCRTATRCWHGGEPAVPAVRQPGRGLPGVRPAGLAAG